MSVNRTQPATIPDDIYLDILSLLPAKTLARFRCVCKSWNTLIRSQSFTESHFDKTVANLERNRRERALMSIHPGWSVMAENLEADGNLDDVAMAVGTVVDYDRDFKMLGSVNGLLCMRVVEICGRRLLLWNPSTRESRNICENEGWRPSIEGFGYDSAVDDYKLVKCGPQKPGFCSMYGGKMMRIDSDKDLEVEIFTVGSNTQRKFEARFSRSMCFRSVGVFASGALHWIFITLDSQVTETGIMSFNLKAEKFEAVISLPDFEDDMDNCETDLTVLGGRLALVVRRSLQMSDEIWVMMEYGVKGSWIKKAVVFGEQCHVNDGLMMPLWFLRNGEVLLNVGTHLMISNVEEKTFRKVKLHDRLKIGLVYIETLISPNRIPNAHSDADR